MISLVMSYFNRLELLRHTLYRMTFSEYKKFEVIIVDDFSDLNNSLDTIHKQFPRLNIKVIKMSSVYSAKTYSNPCIPYNVGFSHASGSKIIIQNPECCHIGDVISYTADNLTDKNYLSFHCYASTQKDLPLLATNQPLSYSNGVQSYDGGCWYNHVEHRPVSYHFTTAITRTNLSKLNGFDERFAHGKNYDDNEFVTRINNMGLAIEYVQYPLVVHQWHGKSMKDKKASPPTTDNKALFEVVKKENSVKANPDKIII